jgi:hypothetical protein
MGIRRTALGGAIIGLVAPTSALAGAVLDSPTNGATHTYSPLTPLTLSWHLDNHSTTQNVILSTGSARGPSGALADVFDSGGAGQTSWRPTAPMWAGKYWWQVETSDVGAAHFSTLQYFTEATVLNYSKWRVYHDRRSHRLALALTYTTNYPRVKITLQLFNAKMKRLVKPIVRYDTPVGPNKNTSPRNINWLPARTVKKGTRVNIRITLKVGTKSVTQTIATKAS